MTKRSAEVVAPVAKRVIYIYPPGQWELVSAQDQDPTMISPCWHVSALQDGQLYILVPDTFVFFL